MGISEEKMKIVINNYFKSECNVNTSIREAFEKGFRIGVKKGLAQSKADTPQTDCPKMTEEEFDTMLAKVLVGQTESTGSPIGDYRDGVGAWQTDCGWK